MSTSDPCRAELPDDDCPTGLHQCARTVGGHYEHPCFHCWARFTTPDGQAAYNEGREDGKARYRAELVAAQNDLMEVRDLMSPNGFYPTPVPPEVDISESVVPGVEWLIAEIERLKEVRS